MPTETIFNLACVQLKRSYGLSRTQFTANMIPDSDDESVSNEKEMLLQQDMQQDESQENKLSKVRELAMMFALLFVQYLALCSDGIIYPFFPMVAAKRGINSLSIGVVFASYDVSRFIGSLAFGSMVSKYITLLRQKYNE